jgi:hypothetical protein
MRGIVRKVQPHDSVQILCFATWFGGLGFELGVERISGGFGRSPIALGFKEGAFR